jgi:hypothetical protein
LGRGNAGSGTHGQVCSFIDGLADFDEVEEDGGIDWVRAWSYVIAMRQRFEYFGW